MRVLVVENNQAVALFIKRVLSNYLYLVEHVQTLAQARVCLQKFQYAVVILDLYLGSEFGLDLLTDWERLFDQRVSPQVLVLTVSKDLNDQVHSWKKSGVAGYLNKPFSLNQLINKVNNLVVRPFEQKFLQVRGELQLDQDLQKAIYQGVVVNLSQIESHLLACLMKKTDLGCSRQDLVAALKQISDRVKVVSSLDTYLFRLRSKLKQLPGRLGVISRSEEGYFLNC